MEDSKESHKVPLSDPLIPWYALGGIIASIAGWFGKRQINRIDNLEKHQVKKQDLDDSTDRILTHITERTAEIKLSSDKAHNRIDEILMKENN
tara:strand:+ start:209 stop:487 length:279 start_codon:yes stop_codon:yes gene_type:complete